MIELVVATAGCTGAATVQSSAGFGFALLLAPVLLVVLSPAEGIVLVLVLGLQLNLLVLFAERRPPLVDWDLMRPILVAAMPGLVVGALIVNSLPKTGVQLVVGASVIAAACGRIGAVQRTADSTPNVYAACAVGIATGILTTATSASGTVLVIWLRRQALGGARLRDSLSAAFLILNLGGAAVLSVLDGRPEQLHHVDWLLILAPAVALGHLAGRLVFERLSLRRHELLVLICVLLAGALSLASGAIGIAQGR